MNPFRVLLALVSLALAGSLRAQDTWEWRSPTPTGNRINSFAYGHGLMVGVGGNGTVLTSPDGATWTQRSVGQSDTLTRVVFDGTRFVAIGYLTIYTSADGLEWSSQTAPAQMRDITYGQGTFVVLLTKYDSVEPVRFLVSTDGVTWTMRTFASEVIPERILFANHVFVAVGKDGRVLTSSDTITWSAVTVASAGTSTSGASPHATAGNDIFLVSFAGTLYRSTDGLVWTDETQQLEAGRVGVGFMGNLGFANGKFYVDEGHHGRGVFTSGDGQTWTICVSAPRDDQYGAYILNLSTLAGGGGISAASHNEVISPGGTPNSTAYYLVRSATGGLPDTVVTANLHVGGGSLIVGGPYTNDVGGGPLVYGLGRFFTADQSSPDGISWAQTGFTPTYAAGDLVFQVTTSVEHVTTVRVSSDGLTSAAIDVKLSTPRAVAFGAHRYVMVGDGGEISSSTDGVAWTHCASPTTNTLNAVLYAFDRFIAAGQDATLLTSADGVTWTQADSAPYTNLDLQLLAAGPDRLVVHATPRVSDASPGTATLPGGIPVVVQTTHSFSSLVYFNGVFLGAELEKPSADYYYTYYFTLNRLWKSTDGVTWTAVQLTLSYTWVDSYDTTPRPLLAVGDGKALLSAHVRRVTEGAAIEALLESTRSGPVVAPTVTYEPVAVTVPRGESARFAVGVSGSGPFTYQWSRNGTAIPGATQSVLTFEQPDTANEGDYAVAVTNAAGTVTSTAARLTVAPAIPLTITTQPLAAEIGNNTTATLSVEVTGSGPITYQWRKDGVAIASATSAAYIVASNSSAAGNYDVVITAPYSTVTSQTAAITWGGFTATATPDGQVRVPVGASVSVRAAATGAHPPFTYVWSLLSSSTPLPSSDGLLTLINVQGPRTDYYSARITDSAGHYEYVTFKLIVVPDGSATMSLTAQPVTQAIVAGTTAHLSVSAPAGANYRYQWRRYGQPIPGATSATLDLSNFTSADIGQYDVVVYTNDYSAAIVSQAAYLSVGSARLTNLSALGYAGTGEETFFQGFVLQGTLYHNVPVGPIIRSIGPGLIRYGVVDPLADPQLTVQDAVHTPVATNDDWSIAPTLQGLPATVSEMSMLGASALDAASHDAALKLPTPYGGLYFVQASGAGSTTGYVLNEIYAPDYPTLLLVNLSARSRVGDRPLIAGFVIGGDIPLKVLIRGVGPGLAAQGVSAPLANPKITLYDANGTALHNNDQWSAATNLAELRAATSTVGAFALTEGSNDAALLETLAPGAYTVHVTSVDGSAGIALVEIYAVP